MSNGITMLNGLPHNVPFVPQVDVRTNLSQQLRRVTGEVMLYMQQQAYANTLVNALYLLVGQNGFNNPAFTQLVQDTIIVLDYVISNSNPAPTIDAAIKEYVPIVGLGAAASYATRNPQVLQSLNNPNLQMTANQTASHYTQLINTAKNWYEGAKMTQFIPQAYPMVPGMMPQQQMMPGMMPQMPYGQPMQFQQPAMAYGAPAMAMSGFGGQQFYGAPQQRPMINPGQVMTQGGFQPQQQFVQQPQGAYVPQVAGGLYNPNMQAQPGYQPPAYGFTQPSTGPRVGGLGQEIPGVNTQTPQQQPAQQQAFVPQAAVAAAQQPAAVPAYMNQPNLGAPAVVGQNLPQQQTVAAAAAVPQTPPAAMTPAVTQPTTQQYNATASTPAMEKEFIANEDTRYRVPNGSGYTRLPFVYDYTTERHVVKINTAGEVVWQQVINKDEAVNLSDHETTPYFKARTQQDLVDPNLKTFIGALDRAATEVSATSIMEKISELHDKDEESITKETAVILRDNLSDSLLIINDCFVASANYKVNYHQQFKAITAPQIAAKVNETAASFRSVTPQAWSMTDETAKLAHSITMSENLHDLHRKFCMLTERMIGPNASPFIDLVTAFVNAEVRRFYGLGYTIESFNTDLLEMLDFISEDEGPEFSGVVATHLHQRLTSTILYAYTPAELNEICRNKTYEDDDSRIFARVDQVVLLPVRSRDVPYTYNGRAGLILATEYQSLNRLITNSFDLGGQHLSELLIVTLDADVLHIHPILNDNSYVMYKEEIEIK